VPDHYRTLGVAPTASADEIHQAYRDLARRLHPDAVADPAQRAAAAQRMGAVNDAWRVLGDADRRRAYDESRRPAPRPGPRPERRPDPEPVSAHDSFQDVEVSAGVGCLLSYGPVFIAGAVLFLILVVTAVARDSGDDGPPRLEPGRCVDVVEEDLRVVPCTGVEVRIVARGVAGTSCPEGSLAVVLPTRTEQVCLAPPAG